MKPATLLASALCAIGCGGTPRYSVYAERDLASATAVGINAWNRALYLGPCPEVGLDFNEWDGVAEITIKYGDAHGNDGETQGKRITIDPRIRGNEPTLNATVAHELGHALGAHHSNNPSDLMYPWPSVRGSPEPTGYDVAKVCAHWWGED